MADSEKMEKLDPRKREKLDNAFLTVDRVVMKKYIADLDKCPVYQQSFNVNFDIEGVPQDNGLPIVTVGTNVMLLKVCRIVFDKEENILDKLTTVYNATSLYEKAALTMLLRSDENGVSVYVGTICKNSDDPYVPQKQIDALRDNFLANFPGSELEEFENESDKIAVVQGIFNHQVSVAAVTGIAALKADDKKDNESYIQGMEKLIDSLRGKCCDVMIIADPVDAKAVNTIKSGYEELYTTIKPFLKSEFTVNNGNGKTVTDSVVDGVTDTTNNSLAKTTTHTLTKGTNSAHTVGGSVGVNTSVNTSATVGVSAAPFGIGGSASATVGTSVGTSVSTDYHYMMGHHKDESDSTGETVTEGTSKAISKQNSIANALSENNGEGLQITYENRTIKTILDKIDNQLERMEECEDYGMYDCGIYFMSNEYATCLAAASTYKSLMQGEKSSVESSYINIWDEENSKYLIPYLSTFNHPIFDISDSTNKSGAGASATASALVSGKELSIYMGLPKKSVTGLPVIKCAEFGRNIVYADKIMPECDDTIELGVIHHMHSNEEQTKVVLDKNSLSSHVFITGSTGSGKSNTVYKLIDEITKVKRNSNKEKVHFMVIEPAKGEYKDIFGGRNDVTVYGTNPKKNKVLRINPFRFPEDIHILEHIERLVEIFNVCWPMYAAMPAVLKASIERAYVIAGWDLQMSESTHTFEGEHLYPTFEDVLLQINSVIQESKYSSDSKGDYVGALTMRVGSLTNGINGQIFTCNDVSDEELFDSDVIIDLSRVGSTETKALIMGLLVIKLQEHRMVNSKKNNSELKHITILEEAHNILKRTSTEQSSDSANLLGKSVEMIASAIAEMRTYGEGFIIADQSPGLMDMSVIRNTNTKIILRLPDMSDRELVGKAANLDDDQIVELAKLQTGVATVYQNNWIEPVLCKVTKWNNKTNKPLPICSEPIDSTTLFKKEVVNLLIRPAREKKAEHDIDENELYRKIYRSALTSSAKITLFKYLQANNVEEIRRLRQKAIYDIFNPDSVLESSLIYRNNMKEWYQLMYDKLVPDISEFNDKEVDKILAILANKKASIDSRNEFSELYQNLMIFMDRGRRTM